MLSENIIDKIYYDYIPLYMRSFFYIHYQVKYYMIHQELKEIYLNLTENIYYSTLCQTINENYKTIQTFS